MLLLVIKADIDKHTDMCKVNF